MGIFPDQTSVALPVPAAIQEAQTSSVGNDSFFVFDDKIDINTKH